MAGFSIGKAAAAAIAIVLPKSPKKGGIALTGTYLPSNTTAILAIPAYQDHLNDLFDTRQASDSRALVQLLLTQDPDMSAALNAFLTISNTEPVCIAYDPTGQIDTAGMALIEPTLQLLTKQSDYTLGFQYKPSLKTICENMRYMLLMRGAIGTELVFDKNLSPSELREIDPGNLFWWEKTPNAYKPELRQGGFIIELDIPTFFMAFHHKDPTTIYTYSSFVSAINTIAARQQVINDLYRIMRVTGYPRMEITVMEEVIQKNMPADIKKDQVKSRDWVNAQLNAITSSISNIRPDQAFVHLDSVTAGTMNDKKPAQALDISPVIDVLNSQNQAALKVMATVIGRGASGVNTGTVEARMFAMNCDELNTPVAEILSNILTFALRVQGFQGTVEVCFPPAELRPLTELEPQLTMRAARLKEDLSLGLISDLEYHMTMYRRLPPPGAPVLMGTNFMQQQTSAGLLDPGAAAAPAGGDPGTQGGPIERDAKPAGSAAVKSKAVKKSAPH